MIHQERQQAHNDAGAAIRQPARLQAAAAPHALAADEALDVVDGAGGVDSGLVLGGVANQALVVGEGHIGGGDAVALVIGDDLDLAIFVDAHARVGGAQVDANNRAKLLLLLVLLLAHSRGGSAERQGCRSRAPGRPEAAGVVHVGLLDRVRGPVSSSMQSSEPGCSQCGGPPATSSAVRSFMVVSLCRCCLFLLCAAPKSHRVGGKSR